MQKLRWNIYMTLFLQWHKCQFKNLSHNSVVGVAKVKAQIVAESLNSIQHGILNIKTTFTHSWSSQNNTPVYANDFIT